MTPSSMTPNNRNSSGGMYSDYSAQSPYPRSNSAAGNFIFKVGQPSSYYKYFKKKLFCLLFLQYNPLRVILDKAMFYISET